MNMNERPLQAVCANPKRYSLSAALSGHSGLCTHVCRQTMDTPAPCLRA